jgi:hypothetical protein
MSGSQRARDCIRGDPEELGSSTTAVSLALSRQPALTPGQVRP